MMKLIIKGTMTTLNEYIQAERSNKYIASSIKRQETEKVYYACREQKLQAKLKKANFNFTWFVKDKRKDPDNIFFAAKFVMDGLVKAGILYNDTQEYVGKITHEVKNDKKERVEVSIV